MIQGKSLSKLLSYSATAGTFLALSQQTHGQIFYHDIVPDEVVSASATFIGYDDFDTAFVDLNLDGTVDFLITAWETMGWGYGWDQVTVTPLNGNAVAAQLQIITGVGYTGSYFSASRTVVGDFENSDQIDAGLSWRPIPTILSQDSWSSNSYGSALDWGLFSFGQVGYIALRVRDGLDFHYGWLRVKTLSEHVTLFEHVLNPVANDPITIADVSTLSNCDVPTGLLENFLSPVSAQLSWNPGTSAIKYELSGSRSGSPATYSKILTSNTRNVGGLVSGDTYTWKVRALCDDGVISPVSPTSSFTVPLLRSKDTGPIISETDDLLLSSPKLTADGKLEVLFSMPSASPAKFSIYDLSGQLVDAIDYNAVEEGKQSLLLDRTAIGEGIYILTIEVEAAIQAKKFFLTN